MNTLNLNYFSRGEEIFAIVLSSSMLSLTKHFLSGPSVWKEFQRGKYFNIPAKRWLAVNKTALIVHFVLSFFFF